jgi:hypothetical protein
MFTTFSTCFPPPSVFLAAPFMLENNTHRLFVAGIFVEF